MGFLMLLIPVLGVVAYLVLRERSTARAAGMSDSTPVCGRCHYRLGGWTSPTCPECGVDIREVGVRVGPRTNQIILGVLAIILAIVVVGPAMATAMSWIFATRSMHGHGRYESTALPNFHATLETEYEWRRFPSRWEHDTSVTLISFVDRAVGGSWRNGRYVGPAKRREQTVRFTNHSDPLHDPRIEQAVRDVLGQDVEEAVLVAHVHAVESLVQTTLDAQSRGALDARHLLAWADGPLRNPGSGGGGGGGGTAWPGIVVTILAVVICGWLGVRLVNRWCTSGWRLPRVGEWECAAAEFRDPANLVRQGATSVRPMSSRGGRNGPC